MHTACDVHRHFVGRYPGLELLGHGVHARTYVWLQEGTSFCLFFFNQIVSS